MGTAVETLGNMAASLGLLLLVSKQYTSGFRVNQDQRGNYPRYAVHDLYLGTDILTVTDRPLDSYNKPISVISISPSLGSSEKKSTKYGYRHVFKLRACAFV